MTTLGRSSLRATYPITFEKAQQLGLKLSSNMPQEILQLMSLYPQPVRRQPSVEYRPVERRAAKPVTTGSGS